VSQVNFFMLPEDEAEFAQVLAAREDTRVFPARGLDTPATVHTNGLTLFNRKLGWPAIVDAIELEAPVRASTTLDSFKDPHVQWSRCYREGHTLHSGRLYAKIGWLDSPAANITYGRWYDAPRSADSPRLQPTGRVVGEPPREYLVAGRRALVIRGPI
jgi:hypothetical protein